MLSTFHQLVGAAGDVAELEYIAALHQTDIDHVRADASIQAVDIRLFLSSRYGIVVSDQEVRCNILSGLNAGVASGDMDGAILDLMELVAALLIPGLLKAQLTNNGRPTATPNTNQEGDLVPAPPGMLQCVLQMILQDVTGSDEPQPVTPELIQRILMAYGETELAGDTALVQEMMQAAETGDTPINNDADTLPATDIAGRTHETTPTSSQTATRNFAVLLNVQSFAQALTHDVQLYDVQNEARLADNINTLFGGQGSAHPNNVGKSQVELEHPPTNDHTDQPKYQLSRRWTLPAIDITAGLYKSKSLIVLLWATILVTYFAYTYDFDRTYATKCQGDYAFAYYFTSPWRQNADAMACEAGNSILGWLNEFWSMSWFGIVFVSLGSIGNSVECNRSWKPMVGFVFILGLVVGSFLFAVLVTKDVSEEKVVGYGCSLLLGAATASLHLGHAASIFFSPGTWRRIKARLPQTHTLVRGTVFDDTHVKQAGARKLARMTQNALDIVQAKDHDNVLTTHYGQAIANYASSGQVYVEAGGLVWAWKNILSPSQNPFVLEGIWLPARMLAGNIAQYVVIFWVLLGGIRLTNKVINDYDGAWAKDAFRNVTDRAFDTVTTDHLADDLAANITLLMSKYVASMDLTDYYAFGCNNSATAGEILATYCTTASSTAVYSSASSYQCDPNASVNYLCPLLDASSSSTLNASTRNAFLAASGFDHDYLTELVREAVYNVSDHSVESLYPSEQYMVAVPMIVGVAIAFVTAASLAIMYIPSILTTYLKLRSGHIPTLRDKNFNNYRRAPDQVALITGSLFWGSLVSSILVGGVVGLVVFFFLWQATAYYAQILVAILIGITAVNIVRLCLVCICRLTLYKSFYRQRPAIANLSMLALEWANFALSVGFIFVRVVKLLLAASTGIGRIDTSILSPNVNRIAFVELDNFPMIHLKDLLSHEAHRHPYIEQLGLMYLMKLRYADSFGKRAGTCWRLLFVYALFPWLAKYRIMSRPEQLTSQYFSAIQQVNLRNSDVSEDDVQLMIQELMAENQRLKEALLKAQETRLMDAADC